MLSTIGVVMTALLTGLLAYALLDISWLTAFLLAQLYRPPMQQRCSQPLDTPKYVDAWLEREAESGGNDPMAIALTIGLISWMKCRHLVYLAFFS